MQFQILLIIQRCSFSRVYTIKIYHLHFQPHPSSILEVFFSSFKIIYTFLRTLLSASYKHIWFLIPFCTSIVIFFFCFVLPFIRLLISCVCNTERNSYDAYIYCPKKTEVKRNRSKVWQQCTPLRILTAIQHSSRFSYSSSRLICIKSFPF